MNKIFFQLMTLLGVIVVFFCIASDQDRHQIENSQKEKKIISEQNIIQKDEKDLGKYFGFYRVKEYFPWSDADYQRQDFNERQQEADLVVGRIIDIKSERLITYDMGRREFTNYIIKRFEVENPQYDWTTIKKSGEMLSDQDWIIRHIGGNYYEEVEGAFTVSLLETDGSKGTQSFFVMKDSDEIVMFSNSMPGGFFVLERCEEKSLELFTEWNSQETNELLKKFMENIR